MKHHVFAFLLALAVWVVGKRGDWRVSGKGTGSCCE